MAAGPVAAGPVAAGRVEGATVDASVAEPTPDAAAAVTGAEGPGSAGASPVGPDPDEPLPAAPPLAGATAADGDAAPDQAAPAAVPVAGKAADGTDAPFSESVLLGALFPRKEEAAKPFEGDILTPVARTGDGPGSTAGSGKGPAIMPPADQRPAPAGLRSVVIGDVDGAGDGTVDRAGPPAPLIGAPAPRRHRLRRLVVVLVVAAAIAAVAFFVVRTVTVGAAAPDPGTPSAATSDPAAEPADHYG